MSDRRGAADGTAAAFSRDAGWMAAGLNGAGLIAVPLVAGLVPGLGEMPVGGVVLAIAGFGLGGAFAGLFAFLGFLHYAARADVAAGEGGAARRARGTLALGITAGTLAYLSFMSGWIFLLEAMIRAAGWAW